MFGNSTDWRCHVCTKANKKTESNCIVCGRSRSSIAHLPNITDGMYLPYLRPEQFHGLISTENIDQHDEDHVTRLHQACRVGNVPLVTYLLENGSAVEATTSGGWRPIHFACQNGNIQLLDLLLQYHCTIEPRTNVKLFSFFVNTFISNLERSVCTIAYCCISRVYQHL